MLMGFKERQPYGTIYGNHGLHINPNKEGYYEAHSTPGLWRCKWRPIQFCLIVDDFGVEYVGIEHFNHLLTLLKKYHPIQTNMAGDKIAGINVQWDFPGRRVCIDMRMYIDYSSPWTGLSHENVNYRPSSQHLLHTARRRNSRLRRTHQPHSRPNAFCEYRRSSGHSSTRGDNHKKIY